MVHGSPIKSFSVEFNDIIINTQLSIDIYQIGKVIYY
jgi:hypothetical protein